ncbi:NAD(P)-dependent dehydrogenase (short-subunit alcohol dehydrogenase family) [Catenulispora sp. MAP12-49]|uniref:SDR family NAD(P)-dependent oxidoreductase n=1 Tax=unclassified Catenulispora TaxID=414885 RepID=UPI003512A886
MTDTAAGRVRRVALVTGAAGDIGRATAALLGARGWTLILTDIDDAGGAGAAAQLREGGADAHYHHLDVASEQGWQQLQAEMTATWGRLDLLYFNSGTSARTPLNADGLQDWENLLDVHVIGAFQGVRACRALLDQASGSVVVTTSIHARSGFKDHAAYAAAKGALEALTRQLAVDCAPQIRVNAICLGSIYTTPWDLATEAELTAIRNRIPLGRIGNPGDVAPVVEFLASAGAAYITGQTIVVDGGRTAWSGE